MEASHAPSRFRSPRLLFRRPAADDAAAIFARYSSDPEVCRYLAWPRHQSLEDTLDFIAFSDTQWQTGPAGPYLVFAETGELVGSTGIAAEPGLPASTGYVFARNAWGRGYATEALAAMQAVSRQLRIPELTACVHPKHLASRRVLEKCGFELDPVTQCKFEFPNLAAGEKLPVALYRWWPPGDGAASRGGSPAR